MPAGWVAAAAQAYSAYQGSKSKKSKQKDQLPPEVREAIYNKIYPAAEALYRANLPQFARFDPNEIAGQDYALNYANYLSGGNYNPNFQSGYQSPPTNRGPLMETELGRPKRPNKLTADQITDVYENYLGFPARPLPQACSTFSGRRILRQGPEGSS